MSYTKLTPGSTVSFNTHSNVIRSIFDGVKVHGIVSADIASLAEDIQAKHLQVKPNVPNLPNSHLDYSYVIVESNGQREAIGLPWIVENSIQISAKSKYQIVIDNVEVNDVAGIQRALQARGVTVVSFEKL